MGFLDRYREDRKPTVREVWDAMRKAEQQPDRERCGYLIQHSAGIFTDSLGAVRISKDGRSNIIGESFFADIDADSDEAFEEFAATALEPDFPHPFLVDVDSTRINT